MTSPESNATKEALIQQQKRKLSFDTASNAGPSDVKKPRLVTEDPYNFDDDDDDKKTGAPEQKIPVELARFGSKSSASQSPVASPGGSSVSQGYKFKSALLNRNFVMEPPKLSSKAVPLTFEVQSHYFAEACDRFIDDMNSKPMSISRRASVESFMAAQAAKAAKKAERKAEKEQQKAEAAERKAEREERKEKERLGLLPPPEKKEKSPKKPKKSPKAKKLENQDPEDPKENEPLSNNNVKEEKPKKGGTWALPIVPKMPQKPTAEKRPASSSGKVKEAASNSQASNKAASQGGLANVWLQAFGATRPSGKSIKQEPGGPPQADTKEPRKRPKKPTYLDIPPEKRRRPKPNFGGLIHFSPNWERSVQTHHEKARMPKSLVDNIRVSVYFCTRHFRTCHAMSIVFDFPSRLSLTF